MAAGTCRRCGHANPADANFCSSCGDALAGDQTTTLSLNLSSSVEDPDVSIERSGIPEGRAALVVTRGPNAGSRWVLESELTRAGRHPDSDIFLDDVTVSRRHAEIERAGTDYVARDVGSLNGLYVNHERVESSALQDGDEVQIGTFKLAFVRAEH